MNTKLADVVVTVALIEEIDGVSYPYTSVYRFDVENVPEFINACKEHAVHSEHLEASTNEPA